MYRVHPETPFCHHICSDRAVYSSGKEQKGVSIAPHRHSAYRGYLFSVHIGSLVPYFHQNGDVRIVNVGYKMWVSVGKSAA